MFEHLGNLLLLIFIGAAAMVWVAGIWLTRTTDVIDKKLGWSEVLGGLVVLAVITNLPEIAITTSAVISKDYGIAVGNILGGIAIQTLVLVLLDFVSRRNISKPLTTIASSTKLKLEGIMLVLILLLVGLGSHLLTSTLFLGFGPFDIAIAAVWLAGVGIIAHRKRSKSAHALVAAVKVAHPLHEKVAAWSLLKTCVIFIIAATATLAGGALLEVCGSRLASNVGIDGILFGSTILAAATALPEISTGIASVRRKEYPLAVSDIFGGNAFLPLLLIPAGLFAGHSLLPTITGGETLLVGVSVVLTLIYVGGLSLKRPRRLGPLGIDSWLVLIIYALSLMILVAIN